MYSNSINSKVTRLNSLFNGGSYKKTILFEFTYNFIIPIIN